MVKKAWHATADRLKAEGFGNQRIASSLRISKDTVRDYFRKKGTPPVGHFKHEKAKPILTFELLLHELSSPKSVRGLAEKYGADFEQIHADIDQLGIKGYQIECDGDIAQIRKTPIPVPSVAVPRWDGSKVIRFGQVSDSHLCSKYQQLSFLKYAYETFEKEGITDVYHSGDIVDGYKMRRGHEYEVFAHGSDEQAKYVHDHYPYVPSIKTKFITGNHDLSFIVNTGHDIGKAIGNVREDLEYLGPERAQIHLTPNCILELWHGRDGSAYAVSYALQKYVEAMSGGEKPNILFAGHRHKQGYFLYRNVHSFEGGCIQAQTPFMRGKKLHAAVGFWLVELEVDKEGTIIRCKPEFNPLYKSVQNDY